MILFNIINIKEINTMSRSHIAMQNFYCPLFGELSVGLWQIFKKEGQKYFVGDIFS